MYVYMCLFIHVYMCLFMHVYVCVCVCVCVCVRFMRTCRLVGSNPHPKPHFIKFASAHGLNHPSQCEVRVCGWGSSKELRFDS